MNQQAKLLLSWALVIGWAAFIFFMSAHTGSDLDDGTGLVASIKRWLAAAVAPVFGPDTDVVSVAAHFSEYVVLGVLLCVALRQTWPGTRLALVAVAAIVLASLYGASDEFHQLFVPGRLCDPADWLTDTLGATLGALATAGIVCRAKQRGGIQAAPDETT